MKKVITISILLCLTGFQPSYSYDMKGLIPINPLENNPETYQEVINQPSFELKRGTLTKNAIKNQYTIAMDKFMQNNVRSSYQDFKMLIDNLVPNDYIYMRLCREMASIGFFNLSELAMSKIQDDDISYLLKEDVKMFYFPSYNLTYKDQIYLAEIYSNIMYNDQSREATNELMKQINLLTDSDYANYLVAFGSMKTENYKQALEYINSAISKNPKNVNYQRLKTEILAQSSSSKDSLKAVNNNYYKDIHTIIFDNTIHASREYILYKTAKNDYWKKYHLAYYYYDEGELNKALRTLQTSISGKKNINKEVFALTARVYYDMKEYEKAQDYALKTIDIESTHPQALTILGDIAYRNKDYKSAQNYYKKAQSKDPSFDAEIKLAQIYQNTGNSKKAKEIYSKILKVSSNSYQAYYKMALLDKDREETYIKKALAINPEFKDGWIDLARMAIGKDNYDSALEYLTIAKYIDENDYRYYYYLGLVLKNKGLKNDADKNFKKSLDLNPDYELAKEELSI